jgi:hypothetical protein
VSSAYDEMRDDVSSAPATDEPGATGSPVPVGHAGALVLCAIIALGLALRIFGIGFMLPHLGDPDGNVFVSQVELLRGGEAQREREFLYPFYPTLIARLSCLGGGAESTGPHPPQAGATRTLEEQLADASSIYLHVRVVVALLSLLIIPGTWLLARRFMGPGASLCAALLMATSILHLWFAQQARPHAASAAFVLLAVVAAISLRRRGRAIDYLVAGLALGLAIASLQSGLAALPPVLLAVILRARDARHASPLWIAVTLAISAAFVRLFYPTLFAGGRLWGGHIPYFEGVNGDGFGVVWGTLAGYEPWILALAIVGSVLAIQRVIAARAEHDVERAKDLAIVLAHALPYFLAIGLYPRTYQRFVIPLLPYLCCLAGYAVVRIASIASPRRTRVVAAVALVLLAPQLYAALKLVSIRRARDTATLAAEWLTEHLKPGADKILVQYPLELPLPSTTAALESEVGMLNDAKHPWYVHQRELAESERITPAWNLLTMPMQDAAQRDAVMHSPVSYLRSLNGDYAMIDVYDGGRRPLVLNEIPPALKEIGERIARFTPDAVDTGSNLPLAYQDDEYPGWTPWFWRILHARCTGPVVEIYKLR